jgi:AcrR family transcriptional regulator
LDVDTTTEEQPRKTRGGHVPTGTSAQRRARAADLSTAKSTQTRELLVRAARGVFIRSGYLDARVSDIVREADIAHGSFYTYFPSKREVFQEVVNQVGELIQQAVAHTIDDVPGDVLGNLERANRRYLDVHRDNAEILALVDQVATADPVILESRVQARRAHLSRIEATIKRLQERGIADSGLDTHTTAGALVSMLSSCAHWYSIDPGDYDPDQLVHTLTQIWARALGMEKTTATP